MRFSVSHSGKCRSAPLSLSFSLFASLVFGQAFAAPVVVPNGAFTDAGNIGTLGGGVLGGSGSGPIGAGPWSGSYAGISGLLAPPRLTIGQGFATISGLGLDAFQIGNSGAFDQVLASPLLASKHYVLAADIDAGTTVLGANVLSSGNVGLALSQGANTLASTQNSQDVALTLTSDRKVHLALAYDAVPGDSGNIGVSLFAHPDGIAAASLISTVNFSAVHLTQAPIPALPPAQIGSADGTPQAATVNSAFSAPLVVAVTDAEGDPLEGVTVIFATPASGSSVALSSTTAVTDVGGRASVTGTANSSAGTYSVMASVDGVAQPAIFSLANIAVGQPPVIVQTSGGQGQSAVSGSPFACELGVRVLVNDAPAAGATVVFAAPVSGASATLSDGTFSGMLLIETTDADGIATVSASANAIPGSYSATATLTALTSGSLGTPVLLTAYPLTNMDANERIFADGFETTPAPCAFNP